MLFASFSNGDLLDEGTQDLGSQFVDPPVLLCVLKKAGNICCGGSQFFQPSFCRRKPFFDLFLFFGVPLGQDAVLFVRDSAKDIVLI